VLREDLVEVSRLEAGEPLAAGEAERALQHASRILLRELVVVTVCPVEELGPESGRLRQILGE
jgi:hypothetical protein